MGATVYGRKALRRFERETGERLVHASDGFVTTVDHRHLIWLGERWSELEPGVNGGCGIWPRRSSCDLLFGDSTPGGGFGTELLRGPCRECDATCGMLHRWDCSRLDRALDMAVNPDYWPRPIHRPLWYDDPRRTPSTMYSLGFRLGLPPEMLVRGALRGHYGAYEQDAAYHEALRQTNALLAQVAPDILTGIGIDPEHHRMEWNW